MIRRLLRLLINRSIKVLNLCLEEKEMKLWQWGCSVLIGRGDCWGFGGDPLQSGLQSIELWVVASEWSVFYSRESFLIPLQSPF